MTIRHGLVRKSGKVDLFLIVPMELGRVYNDFTAKVTYDDENRFYITKLTEPD